MHMVIMDGIIEDVLCIFLFSFRSFAAEVVAVMLVYGISVEQVNH
jgi:hypothetical protein